MQQYHQFCGIEMTDIATLVWTYDSHSKAERSYVGTTVTVGPRLPFILCALLAYKDLVEEIKWWMLQVAGEKQVTNF